MALKVVGSLRNKEHALHWRLDEDGFYDGIHFVRVCANCRRRFDEVGFTNTRMSQMSPGFSLRDAITKLHSRPTPKGECNGG